MNYRAVNQIQCGVDKADNYQNAHQTDQRELHGRALMHIGKLVASRVLPSECSHAPYFAADPQQRRDRCHDYSEQVIANKSHQHAGNGTYGFKDGTKADIPIKSHGRLRELCERY